MQIEAAVDLVHQLLLGHLAHLVEQSLPVGGQVGQRFIRVYRRRRWIGERFDSHDIEAALAQGQERAAAMAAQVGLGMIGHANLRFQISHWTSLQVDSKANMSILNAHHATQEDIGRFGSRGKGKGA